MLKSRGIEGGFMDLKLSSNRGKNFDVQFLNSLFSVVFPMDFIEKGIFGSNFAMLGLGDIVLPGVFIALLLRYDVR